MLGIAVELHQQGHFEWPAFQGRLIDEIARWEDAPPGEGKGWSYYQRWIDALQHLLEEQGLVTGSEVTARTRELLCATPDPGHHA